MLLYLGRYQQDMGQWTPYPHGSLDPSSFSVRAVQQQSCQRQEQTQRSLQGKL